MSSFQRSRPFIWSQYITRLVDVRRLFVQLRARPVEHGHKLYRRTYTVLRRSAADSFAVHVQQLVHIVAGRV